MVKEMVAEYGALMRKVFREANAAMRHNGYEARLARENLYNVLALHECIGSALEEDAPKALVVDDTPEVYPLTMIPNWVLPVGNRGEGAYIIPPQLFKDTLIVTAQFAFDPVINMRIAEMCSSIGYDADAPCRLQVRIGDASLTITEKTGDDTWPEVLSKMEMAYPVKQARIEVQRPSGTWDAVYEYRTDNRDSVPPGFKYDWKSDMEDMLRARLIAECILNGTR